MDAFTASSQIAKVNDELGLVFGYAVVCKELDISKAAGDRVLVEHYDTQGHHIPETVMLKAATDFAINRRHSKDMHKGENVQSAVFNFPMTEDIAKALGMTIEKSGWLIALKPTPEILAKYKSGEYTGFSIGGSGQLEEVAD